MASDRQRHVAVTGASGLIGSRLVPSLSEGGHRVSRIVRRREQVEDILWDPARGVLDPSALEGLDAVVHLAGESIAGGRWTARRKAAIRDSRVIGTRLVAETLAGLDRPPRVLINASAIGYYGNRPEEVVDEASPPGSGFLPETCIAWEAATEPARRAGIRVVLLRTGIVLDGRGGALPAMLRPFRLGIGGRIGDGRQFMSWIALADIVASVRHLLLDETLAGPVNAVAPRPVRNAEFTRVLGRVLGRPTLLPLPAPVVRLVFGELGQALLLDGAQVLPRRLERSGFEFELPDIDTALRRILL